MTTKLNLRLCVCVSNYSRGLVVCRAQCSVRWRSAFAVNQLNACLSAVFTATVMSALIFSRERAVRVFIELLVRARARVCVCVF